MTNLFLKTFKAPLFDHLVVAPAQHFIDIRIMAIEIEQTIKNVKITYPNIKKGFTKKKKETNIKNIEK